MTRDRARGEGHSSPSNEQQDGVRTSGNLSALGVVRVGEASRNEGFVDSRVNVGPRKVVLSRRSTNSAVSQRIFQCTVSDLRRLYK